MVQCGTAGELLKAPEKWLPLSAMKRPDMIFKKVNGLQCIRNGCTATTTILERKNMTVKELYSILDKESTRDWAIMVYADDGKSYEVAYTSKDYGIDSKIGIMQDSPYAFIVMVFLITLGLAMIFDYFVGKIDNSIIKCLVKK